MHYCLIILLFTIIITALYVTYIHVKYIIVLASTVQGIINYYLITNKKCISTRIYTVCILNVCRPNTCAFIVCNVNNIVTSSRLSRARARARFIFAARV